MKPRKQKNELRIVSLAPSATSILCAIGAKKTLVGVTMWCADVAPVDDLPKLGDCWRLEAVAEVVALRPTLVIGSVPFLLGLAVVLPVLGHATWHLYHRVVPS